MQHAATVKAKVVRTFANLRSLSLLLPTLFLHKRGHTPQKTVLLTADKQCSIVVRVRDRVFRRIKPLFLLLIATAIQHLHPYFFSRTDLVPYVTGFLEKNIAGLK